MHRGYLTPGCLALAALVVGCAGGGDEAPSRPRFEITTEQMFEADSITPYAGNHAAVYGYIDEHLDAHIANLQRWVRQRSISAQNDGIEEMAELVRADFETLGFAEAELVPTDGHPGVWGYFDAGAERTLMIYMMYDVQPVDPADWQTPPFEGNLVDHEHGTVLMARGATNQKGPQRALLNAIESIIAVDGKLPINVMITAEGEEEISSKHYPQIIDRYEDRLRAAHGVFFPFNSQAPDGRINMNLGVKGIIYFEIEARGGDWGGPMNSEIHGSLKAIVDAPVWRLVHALASLTSPDGNTVTIPGYYDDIRPPSLEEQKLINGMVEKWNEEQLKQALSVERWIDDRTGADAILEYLYTATLNIDGIWGGYTGEGGKTILPHMATAKVDSRLPPDIDPDEAFAMIRDYLHDNGFADLELRFMDGYPAAQTSVEEAWVQTAIGVLNKYADPPSVSPRLAGSAPFYQFSDRLQLPLVFTGLGHGALAHAPNEYMLIYPAEGSGAAGLADVEKFYVDLIYAFAEMP